MNMKKSSKTSASLLKLRALRKRFVPPPAVIRLPRTFFLPAVSA